MEAQAEQPKHAKIAISRKRAFRILQLTDFHNDTDEECAQKTFACIDRLVAMAKPDLLAVTGDIWCSDDKPHLAPVLMDRDIAYLASLGIPWTVTFGNHDCIDSIAEARAKIAAAPHAVMPQGDEGGHFRITLKTAKDGVTQWDLFFINSGAQWNLPHSLAWFQAESQWLAEARARTVPAVAFFHIPTKNYQAAIDEGRAIGIANEAVLFSGDEDGLAAGMLKAPGNLRACFCGHSHRNDCHFVENGITFAFGRATGHGGYGGEDVPKGGKLIELNPDGTGLKFETLVP